MRIDYRAIEPYSCLYKYTSARSYAPNVCTKSMRRGAADAHRWRAPTDASSFGYVPGSRRAILPKGWGVPECDRDCEEIYPLRGPCSCCDSTCFRLNAASWPTLRRDPRQPLPRRRPGESTTWRNSTTKEGG